MVSTKAERNRTIRLGEKEQKEYASRAIRLVGSVDVAEIVNKTINGDMFEVLKALPDEFADLLVVDPPYNLTKQFSSNLFKETKPQEYLDWLDAWVSIVVKKLKKDASAYICSDWKSSLAIYEVASRYFKVQNRITWEREKGRGSQNNWKNCSEDIWFCTKSNDYYFDIEAVKLKKKVIAPYRNKEGAPKDWQEGKEGNYRLTHPSNLWNDISIPFWSMPENTDHPTQKPEKLIAKLILASSKEGDIVFDPFLGSGTTSVVAKKLNRKFVGIEKETEYCALAEYRLEKAETDKSIQSYNFV